MHGMNAGVVRRAEVVSLDPVAVVASPADQLHQDELAGILFFCSADSDPKALVLELRARFDCPVAGCTCAGEIGRRYQNDGIVAISFSARHFCLHVGARAKFPLKSCKLRFSARAEADFAQTV